MIRKTFRAGSFYPGKKEEIISTLEHYLSTIEIDKDIPPTVKGGIVPHAGWTFSGPTALKVYSAIKKSAKSQKDPVFIIYGAIHVPGVIKASVYSKGKWETPLGDVEIDEQLAKMISDITDRPVESNESVHNMEHSIEVQVPIIKYLFPNAKIVPIMTPPTETMKLLGESIGTIISKIKGDVFVIGSSDLTHYGPRFGFVKGGTGKKGLEWMKENDRRIIDLIMKKEDTKIIYETNKNRNACGGGAILSAISTLGRIKADNSKLLEYTTSYDVKPIGEPSDAVGYAGIVFHT